MADVQVTVRGINGEEASFTGHAADALTLIRSRDRGYAGGTIINGVDGNCLRIPFADVKEVTVSFT